MPGASRATRMIFGFFILSRAEFSIKCARLILNLAMTYSWCCYGDMKIWLYFKSTMQRFPYITCEVAAQVKPQVGLEARGPHKIT